MKLYQGIILGAVVGLLVGYMAMPRILGGQYDLNTTDFYAPVTLHDTVSVTGASAFTGDVTMADSIVDKTCYDNGTEYTVVSYDSSTTTATVATSTSC